MHINAKLYSFFSTSSSSSSSSSFSISFSLTLMLDDICDSFAKILYTHGAKFSDLCTRPYISMYKPLIWLEIKLENLMFVLKMFYFLCKVRSSSYEHCQTQLGRFWNVWKIEDLFLIILWVLPNTIITHTHTHSHTYIYMCVCVCVCVWERESVCVITT